MSVMVQANGAQRETGMYAGVSGVVRKLFKSGEWKEEKKSQVSTGIDIQFEIKEGTQIAILVSYQNTGSSVLPKFPSIDSPWASESYYSICIVMNGVEVYSYRRTRYDTGVIRYQDGYIEIYDHTNNNNKAVTCTLWYI